MSRLVLIASLMRFQGETGVQTHVRAVHDWLVQQGRSVQLVTPFNCSVWQVYPLFGLRRLLDRINKTASVWWYRYWHSVFLQHALAKQLSDGRPCSIYAQSPLSARAALRARRTRAQKVVMVVHFNLSQADEWVDKGAISREGSLYHSIQAFEEKILPDVDALVFVSKFMQRELLRRIPSLQRVVSRVIPNFIDDPGEPVTRAELYDLITIGTLEYRKNQRYALEIIHAAGRLGHALSLTVVGEGPDRSLLEKLARELNIEKQIRFMGFVSHAAELMAQHRACLHVAHMENLPLTLIEALSRGLPVFSPDAGGMPEVFDDGVEGRLIPLEDAQAAARVILECLDDEALMRRAKGAARSRFLNYFEANRVATKLVGFLDGVT